MLKGGVVRYRGIRGDGNCFYRAVIFRYIEILIYTKNKPLLKEMADNMDNGEKYFDKIENIP